MTSSRAFDSHRAKEARTPFWSAALLVAALAVGLGASRDAAARAPAGNGTAPGAVFRVNSDGRVTKDGQVLPVQCANWFGLEGRHELAADPVNPSGAPMELFLGNTFFANGGAGTGRTLQQTMNEIRELGINVIRLPLVTQTLDADDPQGKGEVLKNHPSVRRNNARQQLEEFIVAADRNNIEVILDIHSCSNFVGFRKGRLDARPPWVDANRVNSEFKLED
jgi:aryl-phospho-beta-D-glucosidase BglC (GH1 family)